jgi:hypothetical protein
MPPTFLYLLPLLSTVENSILKPLPSCLFVAVRMEFGLTTHLGQRPA